MQPLEEPEMPERRVEKLQPEHYDKDGKTKYRIGGRLFLIEEKDIESETPLIVKCSGGKKHILFPKKQKFININDYTDSEIAEIKSLL
jgi:hypothetical protein